MSKGHFSADSPQKSVSPRRIITVAVICVLVLALAAVGFFLVRPALDPYHCRMADGISIAGVDVGGMTKGEARKALQAALDETLYRENLTVALPMESITLSPADTGVQVDVRAAVNDAYRMGRSDGSLPGNMDLRPYLSVNSEYIRTALEGYASEFDTEFSDSHYALTGDAPDLGTENHDPSAPCQTLELTVGVPKAHLDVDSACDQILRAYSQAVAACRAGEYRVTVDIPAESAPAELDLDAIYDEICTAPVDDSLDMTEYRFVPGSYGYSFDLDAAKAALAQAKPGETVSVPMTFVEPEILGDAVYFRDVLGSCETKHSDNENRNTNLRLLCEALNGVVVQPGETFSYNGSVGKRTADRGFKPAPAYVKGETVDEIGGGICQTSSTLYLACLLSNLEITERYAHRYVPAYIAWGMDATVSWGGPDYKFTNNTLYPVKIVAKYEKGYLTVQILGTNVDGTYVKMSNEVLSKTPWETIYQEDPTMAPGSPDVVKVTPYTGYKVNSYQTIYDKDGKVIDSHFEASSNYKVRNKVILQAPAAQPGSGTAEIPTVTPDTPSDTPVPMEPTVPAEPAASPDLPVEPEIPAEP